MGKNYVLQALRLMGLEEMIKLSQAIKVKQPSLKKAAGEELVVWNEEEEYTHHPAPEKQQLAKVIPFKKILNEEHEPLREAPAQANENEEEAAPANVIYPAEFLLWQRELAKESTPSKTEAVKGYRRSNEMYVVKSHEPSSQEKIRFASTNGVLVNKKQG